MKFFYIYLLSFSSLILQENVFAETAGQVPVTTPQTEPAPQTSNFTSTQVTEIQKIVADYLTKNPSIVTTSFQAAMELEQKEAVAKTEKAVAENKDKIFKNLKDPVQGNPKGSHSLVVFLDPNCGYCKKFEDELVTLVNTDKDVKIIFKHIPIMGKGSEFLIQAMLAAKIQGKHDQLQKAIFSSDKHLTKKMLLKLASSLGIDTKKLQEDMKSQAIKDQMKDTLELAKSLDINATPTLIINETRVVPGYMTADELKTHLKETVSSPNSNEQKAS